jgi:hypothetical protein
MKADYRQQRTGSDFFQLVSADYHLRMELRPNGSLKASMKGGRTEEE